MKESIIFSHIFGYIHTVFLLVALGHSCMNPFIYFWTDARVRYGFLELIGSIPGVKRCFPKIKWENNMSRRWCIGCSSFLLISFISIIVTAGDRARPITTPSPGTTPACRAQQCSGRLARRGPGVTWRWGHWGKLTTGILSSAYSWKNWNLELIKNSNWTMKFLLFNDS